MRAILLDGVGGPEVLKLGEAPRPVAGPSDLLLRVRAAGLNRADLLQRLGRYPPPAGESEILGMEAAGEVAFAGPDARGPLGRTYKPGDRVMALLAGGGYAEYARVPAAQALPLPDRLSFAEGAAIPEAFLTAWLNLFLLARLSPGDVAVVHAAASGVGSAAVQLCRGVAKVVLATASEAKHERCRALGATHVLARSQVPDQLPAAVREAAGRGADVILDLVGGSYLAANVAALGLHGRLCLVSTMGGASGQLDLTAMLRNRLSLLGSTLRSRTAQQKAKLVESFAQGALHRFENGELRPVLAQTFPLAQAAQAHEAMAGNALVGKIVLEVD